MRLDSYLARLEDMLRSRRYVTFERLYVLPGKVSAVFQATIRYPDGSQLSITERLHLKM